MPSDRPGRFTAAVGRTAGRLLTPLEDFLQRETTGAVLLLAATAIALVWANSPYADSYRELRHLPVSLGFGDWRLEKSLQHVVNDLLMVLFFFLVGLEIKRELLVGELSRGRDAVLPVAAAVGGMVVPVGLFLALNLGTPEARGWAVPMATDIAFAVGLLAVFGRRVPPGLTVFLLALAIVDDLGAVAVIALFYTEHLAPLPFAAALLLWALAFAYGAAGGHRAFTWTVLGVLLWYAVYLSGLHATVAGVMLAAAVPVSRRVDRERLERLLAGRLEGELERVELEIARAAEALVEARSPLHRFEHALAPYVAWLVVPLFALVNAGVAVDPAALGRLAEPLGLGILLGLPVGKLIGITGASWLAVRLFGAALPAGTTWPMVAAAALLAGIGFTMSLFVAQLAFGESDALEATKLAVLAASLLSALGGLALLAAVLPREPSEKAQVQG